MHRVATVADVPRWNHARLARSLLAIQRRRPARKLLGRGAAFRGVVPSSGGSRARVARQLDAIAVAASGARKRLVHAFARAVATSGAADGLHSSGLRAHKSDCAWSLHGCARATVLARIAWDRCCHAFMRTVVTGQAFTRNLSAKRESHETHTRLGERGLVRDKTSPLDLRTTSEAQTTRSPAHKECSDPNRRGCRRCRSDTGAGWSFRFGRKTCLKRRLRQRKRRHHAPSGQSVGAALPSPGQKLPFSPALSSGDHKAERTRRRTFSRIRRAARVAAEFARRARLRSAHLRARTLQYTTIRRIEATDSRTCVPAGQSTAKVLLSRQ